MSESFRRVVAVFLAVTFVVALVPHGLRAADAGVQIAVMTVGGEMPITGKCDGCGDHQKAMTSATCPSLFCVNFVALPSIETVLELPSLEAFEGFAGPLLTGHAISPDPYPPKRAVLS
jgi:hypothetical protein